MTMTVQADSIQDSPNFTPKLYGIGILVVTILSVGIYFVGRFNDTDLARDMQTWQEKLNLIAESRTSDVNNWVAGNFKEMRSLADNTSLQLYMTELQLAKNGDHKESDSTGEVSQKTYLRNLLLYTAQRQGFTTATSASSIPANVEKGSKSGLALIDNNNNVLISTLIAPSTREIMIEHVKQSVAGQEGLIDIRKNKEGAAYVGFVVPVFAVQADHNAASQIGRLIGIKVLDSNLFGLLKHPGTTEKTLETMLVRSNGDKLEYLSPLEDGSAALSKVLPSDGTKLAEAKLAQASGSFSTNLKDYSEQPVLATSRQIEGTPWSLIVKIDRSEALMDSNERRASLQAFFFMIIVFIVLMVVSIWWWANSKRSLAMSEHFQRLASKAQAQEQLLRLVANHQPEPIYIVDSNQIVQFANEKAASEANMSAESVTGKDLRDIRGSAIASQIFEQCENVMKSGQITYHEERIVQNMKEKVIRSAYVPLAHIPVVNLPERTPGVLIVEQDLSEAVHEREQRLNTQRQLIETLVTLVDKRDPFAANHSQLVSQIAYEVAVEMELDNTTLETTRIAGTLMNIGKIVIPTELLTKTAILSPEEKRTIHDSINAAADLLDGISFDGPVAETLRQWQEKWDGTGPLGQQGEAIMVSSRIIAVANAFIGMISPRSWRTAIPMEAANKFLLDQSDTHFDRRVVIALINFVENHSGRAWINEILDGQKNAA